jgi:N-ATPase, AtpR subunit
MMLIVSAAIGIILGLLYFTMLWLSVRRALRRPRWAVLFAASRLTRLVLFGLVFVALAHDGIARGLVMLGGFWAGRWYVLARIGRVGYER